MNRDKIVDWLGNQIKNKMTYECMPENEHGYEYVPRHEVVKIVDGLIPMIKGELKKCNRPVVVPKGTFYCDRKQGNEDRDCKRQCCYCKDAEKHNSIRLS